MCYFYNFVLNPKIISFISIIFSVRFIRDIENIKQHRLTNCEAMSETPYPGMCGYGHMQSEKA